MDSRQIAYIVVLLIGVFIGAVSQVLLKIASMRAYDSPLKEYLNLRVIFAYTLFLCTTLISVTAYRMIPLSLGAVLETTSYLHVTLFSAIIFKEKISRKRIFALFLIILGSIGCAVFS